MLTEVAVDGGDSEGDSIAEDDEMEDMPYRERNAEMLYRREKAEMSETSLARPGLPLEFCIGKVDVSNEGDLLDTEADVERPEMPYHERYSEMPETSFDGRGALLDL